MAKVTKTNSSEEKLIKSLTAAAKLLNKPLHIPKVVQGSSKISAKTKNNVLTLFQVFCPDDDEVIGNPTTSLAVAENTRDEHNLLNDHLSRVVVSI
ncbi:MAG: hypothetical protein V4722_22315 [Bacteroidota bacterium]